MALIGFLRSELRRHPWIAPGVTVTGAAALGSALPEIVAILRGVLS